MILWALEHGVCWFCTFGLLKQMVCGGDDIFKKFEGGFGSAFIGVRASKFKIVLENCVQMCNFEWRTPSRLHHFRMKRFSAKCCFAKMMESTRCFSFSKYVILISKNLKYILVNCCGEIQWIHSTFLDANVQTIMNWSKYVHMAICMHFAIWNSMLDITEILQKSSICFFEHMSEHIHTGFMPVFFCEILYFVGFIWYLRMDLHVFGYKKSGLSIWDACRHFDFETSIQMCVFWRVKFWYSFFKINLPKRFGFLIVFYEINVLRMCDWIRFYKCIKILDSNWKASAHLHLHQI